MCKKNASLHFMSSSSTLCKDINLNLFYIESHAMIPFSRNCQRTQVFDLAAQRLILKYEAQRGIGVRPAVDGYRLSND